MVDPTTTNKIYAIPTHGTDIDTWDVPLNSNFTILDKNFGGVLTKSLSNVNVVLTASEQQNGIIRFSGVLSSSVIITFSQLGSYFMIDNRTTGNFFVVLTTGLGGAAENIAVPQGEATYVMIDGTNVRFVGLDRPGTYWDYAGSAVPNWVTACTIPPYLNCDGSAFSAVTYPYLSGILGTTTLPDFRGRARAYLNGGTSRITTAGSGIDGDTRFSSGGAQTVTMIPGNLPAVDFNVDIAAGQGPHLHGLQNGLNVLHTGGSGNLTTTNADGLLVVDITVDVATLPSMVGVAHSGGSSTPINKMPPATIGGITMIRAA